MYRHFSTFDDQKWALILSILLTLTFVAIPPAFSDDDDEPADDTSPSAFIIDFDSTNIEGISGIDLPSSAEVRSNPDLRTLDQFRRPTGPEIQLENDYFTRPVGADIASQVFVFGGRQLQEALLETLETSETRSWLKQWRYWPLTNKVVALYLKSKNYVHRLHKDPITTHFGDSVLERHSTYAKDILTRFPPETHMVLGLGLTTPGIESAIRVQLGDQADDYLASLPLTNLTYTRLKAVHFLIPDKEQLRGRKLVILRSLVFGNTIETFVSQLSEKLAQNADPAKNRFSIYAIADQTSAKKGLELILSDSNQFDINYTESHDIYFLQSIHKENEDDRPRNQLNRWKVQDLRHLEINYSLDSEPQNIWKTPGFLEENPKYKKLDRLFARYLKANPHLRFDAPQETCVDVLAWWNTKLKEVSVK